VTWRTTFWIVALCVQSAAYRACRASSTSPDRPPKSRRSHDSDALGPYGVWKNVEAPPNVVAFWRVIEAPRSISGKYSALF